MTGTIITKKGVALIAKLLATKQQLVFTRAAVGTGSCPSGYDPASMLDLNQYHMDGMIAGCEADGEEATVTFQISSEDVEEGFIITEAGVYAEDVDEGEILYAYLNLTSDPQYVYPKGSVVQKFAEIDFKTIVGKVESVTAVISPSSLVTREVYEEGMAKKIDADGGNIADAKVAAYTEAAEEYPVPDAGETIKVILGKVIKFIQDAKTGFCKKSELVDNCTSSDTDKPPTAKQAKVLWDKITADVAALATHKSSGDHDGRYYTESEIDNKLSGKANSSHTHDDRYYTESEMNTKLAGKSDSSHGHSGMLTTGSIVNNCTSTNTDKPLAANQGKVLMDKYNQLNSEKMSNPVLKTGLSPANNKVTIGAVAFFTMDKLCVISFEAHIAATYTSGDTIKLPPGMKARNDNHFCFDFSGSSKHGWILNGSDTICIQDGAEKTGSLRGLCVFLIM